MCCVCTLCDTMHVAEDCDRAERLAFPRHRPLPSLTVPESVECEQSPYAAPLPGLPLSRTARHGTATSAQTVSPQRSAPALREASAVTSSSASLSRYMLRSAAGNLSSRGTTGLQWSVLHGRPVIGRDCPAEVGQRVVGAPDTVFKSAGIGTIVSLGGPAGPGFAAVRWDRERGSARPPAEYCVGHNGRHLLELAQLEDIVLGQRYESINGGQGTQQARSLDEIFSQPFGGPGRKRRFEIKKRQPTTSGTSIDSSTTQKSHFLKKGQGIKVSIANHQPGKVTKAMMQLFIRFARGTKRKRLFGYNIDAVKVQTMQSMNVHEFHSCLQYLDVRQDRAFLRGRNPILNLSGIQAQYAHFAPWSHPDAFGELDFDRFALCIESIAVLVGIPLLRFVCGILLVCFSDLVLHSLCIATFISRRHKNCVRSGRDLSSDACFSVRVMFDPWNPLLHSSSAR